MSGSSTERRFERLSQQPLTRVGADTRFFAGTISSLRGILSQRQLIGLVVKRELRTKYKGSATGSLWSLARPLAMLIIYYLFVGQILGAARAIPSFAAFMFTGYATWTLFSESLSSATSSLVSNAGVIRKVSLPREIFPVATTAVAGVTFLGQLLLLVVFVAVTGSPVNLGNLGVAAAGIGMLVTFSLALGILASAATVFFRDLEHLVEVLLMFLFWGSPILYSMALVKGLVTANWVIQIYLLNPITTAVLSMQSAFWAAGPIGVGHLELRVGISWLASLFLLWIAQRVFNRVQGSFAQEL
jgi:ABC-2 type transport system permease protein